MTRQRRKEAEANLGWGADRAGPAERADLDAAAWSALRALSRDELKTWVGDKSRLTKDERADLFRDLPEPVKDAGWVVEDVEAAAVEILVDRQRERRIRAEQTAETSFWRETVSVPGVGEVRLWVILALAALVLALWLLDGDDDGGDE